MISRIWHGWTTPGNADTYEAMLKEEIFVGIQNRHIRGFKGIQLLRRQAGEKVEFVTIMRFDSLDAVREFAGADYREAVVPEKARAVLSRFDKQSQHYEVRAEKSGKGSNGLPCRVETGKTPQRLIAIGLLSWLSMLAIDFFLHGGLLASLYVKSSPFLLSPLDAFRRIPLGYLSFLLLAGLLLWLMVKLGIRGWRQGAVCGLQLGALVWGASALGLLSISTAEWSLLLGWFLGQTVEMGLAGAVAGSGLEGQRLRVLFVRVLALVVLLVVVTIVLQSTGLAPATSVGR